MSAPPSRKQSVTNSLRFRIPFACSLAALVGAPGVSRAQDQAVVNVIAGVLMAEDVRVFDAQRLAQAARHPEPIVRRRAALAIGRIGDPAGTLILLELLEDLNGVVQQDAAFALGLMADPSAFDRLRELVLVTAPQDQTGTHVEAVTAVAKLGGSEAAGFYDELLVRWVGRAVAGDDPPRTVVQALREAWRLGSDAPVGLLAQYAESPSYQTRLAAIYSLTRLRSPEASSVFLRAIDDHDPLIRSLAVRVLTAAYADSADLDRTGIARWINPLVDDPDPHVRVNSLRTLGTYEDPAYAATVANHLSDTDANARVQAVASLGQLGGPRAARLLAERVVAGPHAQRRHALMGLARIDRDEALVHSAGWITHDDWLQRAVGADALGVIGGDTALAWLEDLTRDPDGRVVARAFSALSAVDSLRAGELARELIGHADPVVRTLAANRIRTAPWRSDVDLLVEAYRRSLRDEMSDARIAIVGALGALVELGFSERVAVEEEFLRRYPESDDYLVRRAAMDRFPAAAAKWGGVTPIETGRNVEDYRDIARRLILPAEQAGEFPGLVIETERGRITITLFAAEAPLTVDALLRLADQHYFDGGAWHRVVPNFVMQDGDPRGDGWGGPGFALRDENSRRRYGRGTVGMALSGPDTGGSQFFIAHSPQPHLDGTYAVIGQVDGGMDMVDRITQGNRIRTIRRR